MADLIQIKGGNGDPPPLQNRELGFSKDEKALYIGTNNTTSGNIRLCGAEDIEKIKEYVNGLISDNISGVNKQIEEINTQLAEVKKRLDALEAPSE